MFKVIIENEDSKEQRTISEFETKEKAVIFLKKYITVMKKRYLIKKITKDGFDFNNQHVYVVASK